MIYNPKKVCDTDTFFGGGVVVAFVCPVQVAMKMSWPSVEVLSHLE